METQEKTNTKFTQSITFKALAIVVLTLLLLIPKTMITSLIRERQERSEETIKKINEKWSKSQNICPPVLSLPYSFRVSEFETVNNEKREKIRIDKKILNIAPSTVNIDVELFPEEKHYGIYKTTLYRSEINISGSFDNLNEFENYKGKWADAYITIGISDLKGLVSDAAFTINNKTYSAEAGGETNWIEGNTLKIPLKEFEKLPSAKNKFSCKISLNGSEEINFIPVGKTTQVNISGKWSSPSFVGNFSPKSTIENNNFSAEWDIMHFNRNIPETWGEKQMDFGETSFGVELIETVDQYQQNMRSSKYALMFIALTFVVFFFVELLTKKKIHIIQYLLVGIALILFYSLLLSFSEQIGFALAYLIASIATIGLITTYVYGILKNKTQTGILTAILCLLYTFLYVILQLEDVALLIGSIGMFIILGIIMFVSRKINWDKEEKETVSKERK
jgi:inner membrane protein